ncbi:DUF1878 family protein [Bacillus sp. UMB0893]|uniref:DUF1878 family protein n=1 Tax=Bacillus sp. UMB0893 TaxID=2066053 RepID=UPI000C758118|nr:DUF1878 family protein [Bacillus sp. UMB0893]PLR67447.1 hypothetical protein CYJ36_12340 [Bacillus sp. UMB0893]
MESLEKRIAKLEYYQTLLQKMVDPDKYPFYVSVMNSGLSAEEIEEIYRICDELSHLLAEQKEQGLLNYMSLLTRFAGQLNCKLSVDDTIVSLHNQGMYVPLMTEFLTLIQK